MQVSGKPLETKKLIPAKYPETLSDAERAELDKQAHEKAVIRNAIVARETSIPTEASYRLKFELRKFGRHWNAYEQINGKWSALLPAPSLLGSALGALESAMYDAAVKTK